MICSDGFRGNFLSVSEDLFYTPNKRLIIFGRCDQPFLLGLMGALLAFFIWERWRDDLVALSALLLSTLSGFVHFEAAFLGFEHPAGITVVAVLTISRVLSNAEAMEILRRNVKITTLFPSTMSPSYPM